MLNSILITKRCFCDRPYFELLISKCVFFFVKSYFKFWLEGVASSRAKMILVCSSKNKLYLSLIIYVNILHFVIKCVFSLMFGITFILKTELVCFRGDFLDVKGICIKMTSQSLNCYYFLERTWYLSVIYNIFCKYRRISKE